MDRERTTAMTDVVEQAHQRWFDDFVTPSCSWSPALRSVHAALVASTRIGRRAVRRDGSVGPGGRRVGVATSVEDPRADLPRRPSLCHDGTPIVYSHELVRGFRALRFRMLVEPGDLTLDVPLQIDCSLHVLSSLGAALGWRIEPIARSILTEALPSGIEATRALWGGIWLGMSATPATLPVAAAPSDGSIELRLYANLRHGDPASRWARARAIARVAGVRGGCEILEPLRARIADRAVPVGIGVAFVDGRLPVIRLYVGVEEPSAATLAALTPESHRRSAEPCIGCVATVESMSGMEGGGFARQGVTIGYDLRTASNESAVARVKFDLSLQTIACDRHGDVLRAFGRWADEHRLDGASASGFMQRLRSAFADAACEFISLGAQAGALGATLYARPIQASPRSTVVIDERGSGMPGTTRETRSTVAIEVADAAGAIDPRRRGRSVARCCDAARSFLRRMQSDDGCWREYALEPGASDAWTTALVGCSLLESLASGEDHDAPSRHSVTRAAHALAALRRRDGWGYNGSTACDADSTAWATRLLRAVPVAPEVSDRASALRHHVDAAGGVHTFIGARFGRWAGAHDDVAAVVGCALHESGDHAAARVILDSLLRHGAGRTFWWTTPAYGWARLLEFIELVGSLTAFEAGSRVEMVHAAPPVLGTDPTIAVGRSLRSIAHQLIALPEPSSAFDAAHRLRVAIVLARTLDSEALRREATDLARRLGERLLESQLGDGSWPPSLVLRVPVQRELDERASSAHDQAFDGVSLAGSVHADGRRIVTTAVSLAALHRASAREAIAR